MKMRILYVIIVVFVSTFIVNPVSAQVIKQQLAIVIDDLGNDMKGTKEILSLEAPLTIAVMPFLPSSVTDAKTAHELGHEVIIHMPMEPKKGKRSWLGPGAITAEMSDEEVRERVIEAIKQNPYAVGMNHHMGSKITENERIMRIVLSVCKENGLYYLDSKTTGKSVIPAIAEEIGVPILENQLFFDDVYTKRHILKQANLLLAKIERSPNVIAIGHVGVTGTQMAEVLTEYLPRYVQKTELVPLSQMIVEDNLIDGTY